MRASFDGAAEQAARQWLELADAGRVAESWTEASSLFRRTLSVTSWSLEYWAVRTPLGAVRSRTLHGARVTTRMIGAPDGQYVVFRFHTTFAAQPGEVLERVTTMRDEDGRWRVAGYCVPAPWAPPRARKARRPRAALRPAA